MELQSEQIISNSSQFKKDSEQYCGICCLNCPKAQFHSFGCSHLFCEKCLLRHVKEQIKEYQIGRCPQQGCSQLIDHSKGSVYHVLAGREKKMVDVILSNYHRMINVRKCKFCEEGDLTEAIYRERAIYVCSICGEKHCYNCCQALHGLSVEGCTSDKELPENCQRCQQCLTIVEKKAGCKHIKCVCGYQFCFSCGFHWFQGHICEYKLIKRQGCSWACCCGLKIFLGLFIAIGVVLFLVLAILTFCLLSGLLGGFVLWIKLVEREIRLEGEAKVSDEDTIVQNQKGGCCLLLKFIILLILLPLFWILLMPILFFTPFLNLCYKKKIVLNPSLIPDLFVQLQKLFQTYLIL